MNIKFKEVKLNNFMSFEEANIQLDTNGYVLVSGINKNPADLAKSNGSGKSSIWEAISWAITGETIRGTKEVKRLQAGEKDSCLVELSFDIDNNSYRIVRTKDPSTLKFYMNDKDISAKGIRDTEKVLQEYLPDLNSSLLGSVIILGQGLPQRFTNNTPSGRKEVLEKLSKSDFMIYDLKDRVAKRQNILDEKVKNINLSSAELSGQIHTIDTEIVSINQRLKDIEQFNDIDEQINILLNQESEISNQINNKQNELEINENSLKELQNYSNELRQNLVITQSEIKNKHVDLINNQKRIIDKIKFDISNTNNEINKLKNIKDICPTCGQKIPGVIKPDTSELENRLNDLQLSLDHENFTLSGYEAILRSELKEVEESIKDKSLEISTNISNAEQVVRFNKETLNSLKSQYDRIYKDRLALETKKSGLVDKLDDLKNSIKSYENKKEELNQKILYNNNEKESLLNHLDIINKFNTILKRDFRGYLLKGIIDYICNKSKEYSQIVFETDKINFNLDGNNIDISYDDKPYEALSGGEKQKVDLIVQFSIRDMLCKYLNFSSNIIVLDEIFDNLDSKGCQNVLNLISSKLNDVESIFIITHHSDIEIPCDYELSIIKGEDSISRII